MNRAYRKKDSVEDFTLSEQRFLMNEFIEILIQVVMYRNYGITVKTDKKWKSVPSVKTIYRKR